MTFSEAEIAIVELLKDINWNETPKNPDVLVSVIEAKSSLIRAHKKIKKVIKMNKEMEEK